MKVSVITVLLNAESVVEAAIQSVRMQRYPDIEHLIIDGGSVDKTLSIVNGLKTKNTVVVSEKDSGIYDAMNKGVRLASGDLVIFLNADDRLAQEHSISDLVEAFKIDKNLDVVFGDAVVRDEAGDSYRSYSHIKRNNIGFEMVCHQAIMARRALFQKIGGFDLSYKICADLDWLLRVVDSGAAYVHVPRLVTYYAAGGESDRSIERRIQEKKEILCRYRNAKQRAQNKVRLFARRRLSSVLR